MRRLTDSSIRLAPLDRRKIAVMGSGIEGEATEQQRRLALLRELERTILAEPKPRTSVLAAVRELIAQAEESAVISAERGRDGA